MDSLLGVAGNLLFSRGHGKERRRADERQAFRLKIGIGGNLFLA
jgi:hypothetical protein